MQESQESNGRKLRLSSSKRSLSRIRLRELSALNSVALSRVFTIRRRRRVSRSSRPTNRPIIVERSDMPKIQSAFENLIGRELTLSKAQISQGSTSHNYIRDLLGNKHTEDAAFPRLIDGDFLSGSYARGTKIFPLDDVDVMMVIDGTGLVAINQGTVLDAEVRGSGEGNNPIMKYFGEDHMLDSRKVLDALGCVLKESHPTSKVSKDQQAINVWLSSYDMGIDVVPCFHIIPKNGVQDFYYIPRGNGSAGWMTTNPKVDARISDDLHTTHNGLFKGVVRLAKFWNEISNAARLRSYHVETAVWHAFDNCIQPINSYEEGLGQFFQHAPVIFANSCADKTKLGGPVDSYINSEDRRLSVNAAASALTVLSDAYFHLRSTENMRLEAWGRVFGDSFQYDN